MPRLLANALLIVATVALLPTVLAADAFDADRHLLRQRSADSSMTRTFRAPAPLRNPAVGEAARHVD